MSEIHFNNDGSIKLTRSQQSIVVAARECGIMRFTLETTNSSTQITVQTYIYEGVRLMVEAEWWNNPSRFRRGAVTYFSSEFGPLGSRVESTTIETLVMALRMHKRRKSA